MYRKEIKTTCSHNSELSFSSFFRFYFLPLNSGSELRTFAAHTYPKLTGVPSPPSPPPSPLPLLPLPSSESISRLFVWNIWNFWVQSQAYLKEVRLPKRDWSLKYYLRSVNHGWEQFKHDGARVIRWNWIEDLKSTQECRNRGVMLERERETSY